MWAGYTRLVPQAAVPLLYSRIYSLGLFPLLLAAQEGGEALIFLLAVAHTANWMIGGICSSLYCLAVKVSICVFGAL